MIPELGHFALILALAVALVQGTLPLLGAARGDGRLMALGRTAALTQAFLVILAFGALTQAYVTSDFSVANVVANSHSAKPLIYKISGVWGNHEGSMLLWALILSIFGAAVAIFGANLPDSLRSRVLAIQAWIGVGFLAFLLFTSNPFERLLPAPLDGNGLNPLLQDPGLAFHPPLLYLGYVGLSVTYAFAIAALLEGRVDAAWARWVRPWTLAAWCFLTLGIALGSWWAYYILGWGGFWFWDPVENASLMPWLAGTALLHSAIVVEKRDSLKSWTVLLAILAFSLSLLGTFLVRSGVLTSVHAFAQDPARGMYILGFLLAVTGGGLALYAWRAPKLESGGLYQPVSREGALILNNLLLCTLAATVLLGTLYPLFLDLLTGNKVSVGPPFFNATFVPICAPLFAALCVGPFLGWKRAELLPALMQLRVAFIVALIAAIVASYAIDGRATLAALAFGFGVWLILGSLFEFAARLRLGRAPWAETMRRLRATPRASFGMTIAHAALGVVVLGAVATGAWHLELIRTLKPGETVAFAGYDVTLQRVDNVQGPNYIAERATLAVRYGGKPYTTLQPERRLFLVQRRQVAETAIHTNLLRDFYATLGEGDANSGWTIRLYLNPLAPWIWLGAALCALGGFVSLSDRRLRIGAPHGRQERRPTVQAAE
jgi:cytochrome c-type biogenesis protein CcmF